MENEIKEMLEEEIKEEIRKLSKIQTGSKEKTEAIENLATLHRLKIEETKVEIDSDDKKARQDEDRHKAIIDEHFKEDEKSDRVKDRYFRIGMETAGIILPLAFYAFWMKRGFKFEENGTYTSTTFRGLFNRFKPTK